MIGSPVKVDGERLLARLDALAAIGATAAGGVTREAWGLADLAARDLVAGWMTDAGLAVTVDPAANLIGRRPGRTSRSLATGSHLDTVVEAGVLDGAYGVLAGLAVAEAFVAAGMQLDHSLIVAAFANEEGARGTAGMTGSHACVGRLGPAMLEEVDDEGTTVGDRIRAAGGDPAAVALARWELAAADGFVELHIEQGPVLDVGGVPIGVVTGITGRQALDVEVTGAANHAGTTPMSMRHDAVAAAAEMALAVEALPGRGLVRVATTGRIVASPNVRNVVPGQASLGIDVRDEDGGSLDAVMPVLEEELRAIAARRGVEVELVWGQRVPPVATDPAIVAAVRTAADHLGLPWLELPSGAGHDAQVLGTVLPVGMVFVPSLKGISHSPREHTHPADLVAGADVLANVLLRLDGRCR